MRHATRNGALMALPLVAAAILTSQPEPREQVGPLAGGGFLLNSGWKVQPAGRQVALDTLPMSLAVSPDGKYLLVLNAGYNPPAIIVLDAATGAELSRTRVADAWLGLAISPAGDRVYVGGGTRGTVLEFSFAAGRLASSRALSVAQPGTSDFIGDVALSPDGALLYAANLYRNTVAVVDLQSGSVTARWPTGRRPYRVLPATDGSSVFVSSWADGEIVRHDAGTGAVLARIAVGDHPADMLWRGDRLLVAAAHTNAVYALGAPEGEWRVLETISVALTPRQPPGMLPSALALSQDGARLYVACSGANAVAVVDVSADESRVLGFVPVGWYPTAVTQLIDGRLIVLNGLGARSYANPRHEYVARLQTGSASIIEAFSDADLETYTAAVLANSPYRDEKLDDAQTGAGNPIPARPGDESPIRYVVYIVKENRTYDQVLGDMPQGNGDASLVMFGEQVTPNQHKIAREFVLFDNFYVNADVSAQGHNWSTASMVPDYVEKLWPNNYGGRGRAYDFEEQDIAARPAAGYIWTRAAQAGLRIGNYGYMVNNRAQQATGSVQVQSVNDPVLRDFTNMNYRGFDLDYPDVERAKVFLNDLRAWEENGADCPRLIVMRLGNNHTSGITPRKIAPLAAVADNDYALGTIVDALSHSRFWPRMAIFVLEDDAQDGPDHVDSHRSPVFVISPYARRGIVDGTMYNTTSVLRTMELILALEPLTHFDAGARPMAAAFQADADPRPYTAEPPRIPLDARNPSNPAAPAMDFTREDRVDEEQLNEVLWRAVKGTAPPPPVRSRFSR